MNLTPQELDELEATAITALVKQAAEGSTSAASAALGAVERARKTQAARLHDQTMAALASAPERIAYLSRLGLSLVEVAQREGGRSLTAAEVTAWAAAQEERLLEVRAVELSRMRRGEISPPDWATKRHEIPGRKKP